LILEQTHGVERPGWGGLGRKTFIYSAVDRATRGGTTKHENRKKKITKTKAQSRATRKGKVKGRKRQGCQKRVLDREGGEKKGC
jgi:hypothetical protein